MKQEKPGPRGCAVSRHGERGGGGRERERLAGAQRLALGRMAGRPHRGGDGRRRWHKGLACTEPAVRGVGWGKWQQEPSGPGCDRKCGRKAWGGQTGREGGGLGP